MMKEAYLNRDPMIIVEKKISTSYDLDVYTSSYYMIVMYFNRNLKSVAVTCRRHSIAFTIRHAWGFRSCLLSSDQKAASRINKSLSKMKSIKRTVDNYVSLSRVAFHRN